MIKSYSNEEFGGRLMKPDLKKRKYCVGGTDTPNGSV